MRRKILARRAAVTHATRAAFADALVNTIQTDFRLRSARRVAIYDAMASEAPTAAAIASLHMRGAAVYLPVIRGRSMYFVHVAPDAKLRAHPLGMRQPRGTRLERMLALDVVLMPLAGFDATGQRLGMGGGFYDRALATRRHRRAWRRPWLIGLAYSVQGVDALPAMPHDVPMDAVITEHGLTEFTNR